MTFPVSPRRSHRFHQQSLQLLGLGLCRGIRRKLVFLTLVISLLAAPGFDLALRQAPVLASSAVGSAMNSLRDLSTFLDWLFGTKSVRSRRTKRLWLTA